MWFQGTAAEAVQLAQSQSVPLLVALVDDEAAGVEAGENMLGWLQSDDAEVKELASSAVCLRVLKESQEYHWFIQLVHVTQLPVLVILRDGAVGGIVSAIPSMTKREFLNKLRDALRGQMADTVTTDSDRTASVAAGTTNVTAEIHELSVTAPTPVSVTASTSTRRPPAVIPDSAGIPNRISPIPVSPPPETPLVLASDQWKSKVSQERQERERIREQIARDRAELEARRKTNLSSTANQNLQRNISPLPNIARIQIRQTDGSTFRGDFSSTDTLLRVREFIHKVLIFTFCTMHDDELTHRIVQMVLKLSDSQLHTLHAHWNLLMKKHCWNWSSLPQARSRWRYVS